LPEAQIDRFMMKVVIGYPSVTEEFVVVERALAPAATIQRIVDPETLVGLQQEADRVYVDPSLIEYAVQLAHASREPGRVGLTDLARYVAFGASPRSSISLVLAGRALAYIRGREYVVPEDLTDLALDVLRHRLVLSYEALSDEVTADLILSKILANVQIPEPAGRAR
jgi:MoxR-like ATPase